MAFLKSAATIIVLTAALSAGFPYAEEAAPPADAIVPEVPDKLLAEVPADDRENVLICAGHAPSTPGTADATHCATKVEFCKATSAALVQADCNSLWGDCNSLWGGALKTSGSFTMMAADGCDGCELSEVQLKDPDSKTAEEPKSMTNAPPQCFAMKGSTLHAAKDTGEDETEAEIKKMLASDHFDCAKACGKSPPDAMQKFNPVAAFDSTRKPPAKVAPTHCFIMQGGELEAPHATQSNADGGEVEAKKAPMNASPSKECSQICGYEPSAKEFKVSAVFASPHPDDADKDASSAAQGQKLICAGHRPEGTEPVADEVHCLSKDAFCKAPSAALVQARTRTGNAAWGGALMTSGSFTMIPSGENAHVGE